MSRIKVPKVLIGFNFLVSRMWLVLLLIALFLVISLALSTCAKDFTWLSAFGGVMTVFGLLLTVSHSVPKTDNEIAKFVQALYPDSRDGILSEHLTNDEEQKVNVLRSKEANRILKSEARGLVITILGTVIWAYAGFLNEIFWSVA